MARSSGLCGNGHSVPSVYWVTVALHYGVPLIKPMCEACAAKLPLHLEIQRIPADDDETDFGLTPLSDG